MSEFNTSINLNAVIDQYEKEQTVTQKPNKIQFDTKNYLQARLGPGEDKKVLKIRLLPFTPDGATPFEKVFMHTVKVNKNLSDSGWKTFVCPTHNRKDGKLMGNSCPFCDLSAQARELKNNSLDEPTKKKYGDIEFLNRVKEMYIVRCIERGHEEDGVKFWLFSASSRKHDGVYDKIVNLANTRNEEMKQTTGEEYSIFDLNNGKDLIITLTKASDGKTNVQVIDFGIQTPLSNDYDEGMKWINDQKKWNEVYTLKPYEYMAIVASGGVPRYSKELGRYVDKEEEEQLRSEAEKERLEEALTKPTMDFSEIKTSGLSILNGSDFEKEIDDLQF